MAMSEATQLFNAHNFAMVLRAIILIIAGYFISRLISAGCLRLYQSRHGKKNGLLFGKIIFYAVFILFIIAAMRALGFNLSILLGATGVLTIALGFASQTSASNLISGLFLVGERAFNNGDTINVNGITGEVLGVDLLSVKLRQADNTLVRIPNEVMIKTQIINLSHFPARRLDCLLSVGATTDIAKMREILLALVKQQPLCLTQPEPILVVKDFADTTVHLQFSVWSLQQNFVEMKYLIQEELLSALIKQNIIVSDGTMNIKILKETN